jgi:hypothetical protein
MLTPKEKEYVINIVQEKSPLHAAKWLVNKNIKEILSTPVSIDLNDLPDTAILADGLAEIEVSLECEEYQSADDIAFDTANDILYDLGYN